VYGAFRAACTRTSCLVLCDVALTSELAGVKSHRFHAEGLTVDRSCWVKRVSCGSPTDGGGSLSVVRRAGHDEHQV